MLWRAVIADWIYVDKQVFNLSNFKVILPNNFFQKKIYHLCEIFSHGQVAFIFFTFFIFSVLNSKNKTQLYFNILSYISLYLKKFLKHSCQFIFLFLFLSAFLLLSFLSVFLLFLFLSVFLLF